MLNDNLGEVSETLKQPNFDQNAKRQSRQSPKPAETGERRKNGGVFANNAEGQSWGSLESTKIAEF